jgi:type IV pilus biogenesis protein CpaD/CtpE
MPRHSTRLPARPVIIVLAALALAACASNPDPELEPDAPVRIARPATPIKYGDCAEAARRAAADRELFVDRLPSPRAKESSAIPVKSMPAAVRTAKYSEVRTSVLVDTVGRADMSTFTVVKTTHPWLASSVKSAVARWTFDPAVVAGCKVPRIYNFNLHSGKR